TPSCRDELYFPLLLKPLPTTSEAASVVMGSGFSSNGKQGFILYEDGETHSSTMPHKTGKNP
ncbi:hypothetical protein, partial [Bacteroides heparinolyticus]|uniref:hypothetical protein n=1 Tax=Prevotella heparinolytica TaxID=28113 RepID=UPI00359F8105